MRGLIEHLIEEHLDDIVAKSLLHCHTKNLHSILFTDLNEYRYRLFIADIGHDLWSNYPDPDSIKQNIPMSIAFHSHHSNITLVSVYGNLYNIKLEKDEEYQYESEIYNPLVGLSLFSYSSHIRDGKGGFVLVDGSEETKNTPHDYTINLINDDYPGSTDTEHMRACEIHTIAVEDNKHAAWFVYEGKQDTNYKPLVLSNANLTSWSSDGLYQKPTKDDIFHLLRLVELI